MAVQCLHARLGDAYSLSDSTGFIYSSLLLFCDVTIFLQAFGGRTKTSGSVASHCPLTMCDPLSLRE